MFAPNGFEISVFVQASYLYAFKILALDNPYLVSEVYIVKFDGSNMGSIKRAYSYCFKEELKALVFLKAHRLRYQVNIEFYTK